MFPTLWEKSSAIALTLSLSSIAGAAVTIANTPLGATTGGQPVNAKATFTTSAGQVSIVLENLQSNPTSVVQALSGLRFTLDGGQTGGSLASSSGLERAIAGNGSFADLSSAASGWEFSNSSSPVLTVLGTPTAPEHLVIGPPDGGGIYSNANGSIAGNGPHNPFFGLSANFTLNITGVTGGTLITDTTFVFNTSAGNDVPGQTFVPEPAAALLLAPMLLGRRRR